MQATGALWNLAATGAREIMNEQLAPIFVQMIGTDPSTGAVRVAVGALKTLLSKPEYRKNIADAGCLKSFMRLLRSSSAPIQVLAPTLSEEVSLPVPSPVYSELNGTSSQAVPNTATSQTGHQQNHYSDGIIQHVLAGLWYLSLENQYRANIISMGAVPILLKILREAPPAVTVEAAGLLKSISLDAGGRSEICAHNGLQELIRTLSVGSDVTIEHAAAIFRTMATDSDFRYSIINASAVPLLVQVLYNGNAGAKEHAAGALWNLTTDGENKAVIISAGAVPLLTQLVREGSELAKIQATAALASLNAKSSNRGQGGK